MQDVKCKNTVVQLVKKRIGRSIDKKVCRKPEASLKDESDYIDVNIEEEDPLLKGMYSSTLSFNANSKDINKKIK